MTAKFPDMNLWARSDTQGLVLDIPDQAANKAASRGYTLGMFLLVRPGRPNWDQVIWGKRFGTTNGGDASLAILSEGTGTNTLRCFFQGGATTVGQPNPIRLVNNVPYFVALIVTSVGTWLVACPCGGTAQVQAMSTNSPYTEGMTSASLTAVRRLGGANANARCFTGALSDVFMLRNADFPLVSGAPSPTVIQNIANRTQSIDTLQALFTNGTVERRFYYKLAHGTDLVDSWGLQGALTYAAIGTPGANRTLYLGPALDPNPLRPRQTLDHVSQVMFGVAGDVATARTTIGADSGTYTGITPNNIQARLVDAITGAEVHARRVVDPAPSGGTWAENENAFTNVPIRAGWMLMQYRAYGAGDVPLTDWATAWAFRGAGINLLGIGQSGFTVPIEGTGSGLALETTAIGCINVAKGHLPHSTTALGVTQPAGLAFQAGGRSLGGGSLLSDYRKGVGQFIREFNQLYPGVPVCFTLIGEAGCPLVLWRPPASTAAPLVGRWQALKDAVGVKQPYIFFHMAHNAGPGDTYNQTLRDIYNYMVSILGAPVRSLHTATGRGAISTNVPLPTTFNTSAYSESQELLSYLETQEFCEEEEAAGRGSQHWWFPWDLTTESQHEVFVATGGTSGIFNDPHTGDSVLGGGRWGTTIFNAVASGCRWSKSIPMKLRMRAEYTPVRKAVIELVPGVVL